MFPSFYDEFEKIGRATGEGSRGGKVVGHTKSGDPIYESSSKKKGFWSRHGKTIAGAGAAAVGLGILGGLAARRAGKIGQFRFGGAADDLADFERRRRAFESASEAYGSAGGWGGPVRGAKASRETWDRYKKAGDEFFGEGDSWWSQFKRGQQARYDKWKQYHRAEQAREGASGARGPRGGARGRARQEEWRPPPPPPPSSGPPPGTRISGLGRVKTKDEARKAYKAQAFKSHPDKGGSTAEMQDVNAEWDAFRNSPAWEKLAMMRYWSSLASALIR